MSPIEITGLICLLLLVMIVVRIPVGLSMFICGILGLCSLTGSFLRLAYVLVYSARDTLSSPIFFLVPLFVLIGQFALHCGVSSALFRIANACLGQVKGGVAMGTVLISAILGVLCGGSFGSNVITGQITLQGMKKYGYSGDLATGTVAAGSTLGVPGSLVVYALMTEQSVFNLLKAALLPFALAILGYCIAIAIFVRIRPASLGEGGGNIEIAEVKSALGSLISVLLFVLIFMAMLGSIYTGMATAREVVVAAVFLTGIVAVTIGGMRWQSFKNILLETATSSGRILFLLLGAAVFAVFLNFSQAIEVATTWLAGLSFSPYFFLFAILAFYLILGCFIDSLSIVAVSAPFFFPIMAAFDFGLSAEAFAAWYGILVITALSMGSISPPIGMNMFFINILSKDVPLNATYRGVVPFLIADFVRLGLLIAFPFLAIGWLS